MKQYELVTILDISMAPDQRDQLVATIESHLPEGFLTKDDMWPQTTYHFLPSKASKAYYITYHIEINISDLTVLKKKLSLTQGVLRYVIFTLPKKTPFVTFQAINDIYTEKIAIYQLTSDDKPKKRLSRKDKVEKVEEEVTEITDATLETSEIIIEIIE